MEYNQKQDTMQFNKNLKMFGLEDAGLNTQLKMLKPSARQKVLEGRSKAINNIDSGEEFKLTEDGLFGVKLGPNDYLPIKNKSEDIKNANTVYKDYLELQKEKRSKLERQYYEEHGYIDLNAGLVDGDGNPIDQPKWEFMSPEKLVERKNKQGIAYPKGRYEGKLQTDKPQTFFTEEQIPSLERWLYEKGYRKPENFEDFTERTFGIRIPRRAGTPTVTVESSGSLKQDAEQVAGTFPDAVGGGETQVADESSEIKPENVSGIESELNAFLKENNLPRVKKLNSKEAQELENWANSPRNRPGGFISEKVSEFVDDYGGPFLNWLQEKTAPVAVAMMESNEEPAVEQQPTATQSQQVEDPKIEEQIKQQDQSVLEFTRSVERLSKTNPNIVNDTKGGFRGPAFLFTVAEDGKMDEVQLREASKFIEERYLAGFRNEGLPADTAEIDTDKLIDIRKRVKSDAVQYLSAKYNDVSVLESSAFNKEVDDAMRQYDSIINSVVNKNLYQGEIKQDTSRSNEVTPPLLLKDNVSSDSLGLTFDNKTLVNNPPTELMDTRSIIPDNDTEQIDKGVAPNVVVNAPQYDNKTMSELELKLATPIPIEPEFKGVQTGSISEGDNTTAFATPKKEENYELPENSPTVDLDVEVVDESASTSTPKKGLAGSLINAQMESQNDIIVKAVQVAESINTGKEVTYKGESYNVEIPPEALVLFVDLEAGKTTKNGETLYHVNLAKPDGNSISYGIGQMQERTLTDVNNARKLNGETPITPEDFKTDSRAQLEATASYLKYIIYPECADRMGEKWDKLSPSERLEVAYLRYNGAINWSPESDKGWDYSGEGKGKKNKVARRNHDRLLNMLDPMRKQIDKDWTPPSTMSKLMRSTGLVWQ